MPNDLPLHGHSKPTARQVLRASSGRSLDWRFPDTTYRETEDKPGKIVCPRCHAISLEKRWFLDEALYDKLRGQQGVTVMPCPGCERIERGIFEGVVKLAGAYLATHKQDILNLVRNEEDKAREDNPLSRLASIHDEGDQVEIMVTTQWLAERIGKELRKAHKGDLQIDHLKGDKSSRVSWHRD